MLDRLPVGGGNGIAVPRPGPIPHPTRVHAPATLPSSRTPRRTGHVHHPHTMMTSAQDRLDPYRHLSTRPALVRKRTSQQSARSSNAEGWFDDSNRNVRSGHRPGMSDGALWSTFMIDARG